MNKYYVEVEYSAKGLVLVEAESHSEAIRKVSGSTKGSLITDDYTNDLKITGESISHEVGDMILEEETSE